MQQSEREAEINFQSSGWRVRGESPKRSERMEELSALLKNLKAKQGIVDSDLNNLTGKKQSQETKKSVLTPTLKRKPSEAKTETKPELKPRGVKSVSSKRSEVQRTTSDVAESPTLDGDPGTIKMLDQELERVEGLQNEQERIARLEMLD